MKKNINRGHAVMRRLRPLCGLCVSVSPWFLFLLLTGAAHAQPAEAEKPPQELPKKLSQELPNTADEKLVRDLVGDAPGPPTVENPLESAVAGMRSARDRLEQADTSEKTRAVQEQVVRDLQKLIDLANQAQQQQQQQQAQRQQQQRQRQRQAEASGNSDPMEQPMPSGSQPAADPGQELARQSSDEMREGSEGQAGSRRRSLLDDVWGHLPPAVRQKLLMMNNDAYLQKYEDLRRLYFESLAEQNRN